MSPRFLEFTFLGIVVVLVALVAGLNCFQGTLAARILGVLQCNYGLGSDDFRIKAGAGAILILFLGLIFGPIVAAVGRPQDAGRSRRSA